MVLHDQSDKSYTFFRVTAVTDTSSDLETLYGEPAPASGSLSTLLWDETLRQSIAVGQASEER